MRTIQTAFIVLLFAMLAMATAKRPIAFEDFFAMQRVGSLTVSPDGQTAAYSLTTPNIAENTFNTQIWLLNLKTGKTRRFTKAAKSSSGPVWTPDGSALYFNRSGQIWKQELNADSARQVTRFAPGAAGVVFNADGSSMLFSSEVYPECKTEACNKEKMEAAKQSKVKARLITHLLFRHWNRWLEGKRSHVFLAKANGEEVRDLTPGDYDAPPLDLGSAHDYTFSPDGKTVCFVRNTDKIVAASTNNDLFLNDLKSGAITRLTQNKANDNNPHFSPDGRYLAFASMSRPGFEADRQRLMLYDFQTKTFTDLTPDFTLSVETIFWHPNGKEIYFTATEAGYISLYKVGIHSTRPQAVLKGHFISDVQFANANTLIFKMQKATMPYEIFKMNLNDKQLVQLTHINRDRLDQLDMHALEPFSFTGAKGDVVHGFLIKPPHFDPNKKYPAVELIHGGPQGEWGDDFHYRWNYQMFAAPGYVVFVINFHGSRGYGQKFMDAVSKDWGGAPYEDIKIGTDYVLNHYPFIDKNRVGAAGASYGGFMINWIEGAENPFQCLVSHDGVYDQPSMYGATEELWFPEWEFNGMPWQKGSLYQKWNPAARAAHFKTPMLVVHGEHDYRVPYTQGLQLFTALQRQGVESELLFFPDEDHFVRKPQNARLWWKTVHEWFARFLKNK